MIRADPASLGPLRLRLPVFAKRSRCALRYAAQGPRAHQQCKEELDVLGRHAWCCLAASGIRTRFHDSGVRILHRIWAGWGLPVAFSGQTPGLSAHDPGWMVAPDLSLVGDLGAGL